LEDGQEADTINARLLAEEILPKAGDPTPIEVHQESILEQALLADTGLLLLPIERRLDDCIREGPDGVS
jgi:hypothetical protein